MYKPIMRIVQFKHVPTLRTYADYAIDEESNLWSFKHQKIKKLNPFKKLSYRAITLLDVYSKRKDFYVHRLMCICFLPTENLLQKIRHIDGDGQNNKLNNLEWMISGTEIHPNENNLIHLNTIELNKELVEKINKVYYESLKKGLKLPNKDTFVTDMMNQSLNEHINQYGLKRMFL